MKERANTEKKHHRQWTTDMILDIHEECKQNRKIKRLCVSAHSSMKYFLKFFLQHIKHSIQKKKNY